MIASELATLAVEDGSGPSTLRLVLNRSGLTVGVRDGSPDLPYRPKAPRLGLEVIDALSSGHRVTLHPDGKTVWARVPHPPPAPDEDG